MKAFPSVKKVKVYAGKFGVIDEKEEIKEGMDLRDYFAAKAMQSLLTHDYIYLYDKAVTQSHENVEDYVVETAYFIADEMMRARKQ